MEAKEHMFKFKHLRRLTQTLVLIMLIAIPYYSQNPLELPPSRIVLGHLPDPSIFPLAGDTWSFSAGDFRLTHPVAFIEEILSSKTLYFPLVISVLIPLLITIVLGRVFCSWVCPVGFLLELNQKISRFLKQKGLQYFVRIRDFRYALLLISLIFVFFFAFPLISIFDPPHIFGRELMYIFTHQTISLSGTGILLGIVLFETFSTPRTCCNYFCPSGGALSLLGSKRSWRIRMDKKKCILCSKCDEVCPYYLEPMGLANNKDFDWIKCDNCGLCRDICPVSAISYTIGKENKNGYSRSSGSAGKERV